MAIQFNPNAFANIMMPAFDRLGASVTDIVGASRAAQLQAQRDERHRQFQREQGAAQAKASAESAAMHDRTQRDIATQQGQTARDVAKTQADARLDAADARGRDALDKTDREWAARSKLEADKTAARMAEKEKEHVAAQSRADALADELRDLREAQTRKANAEADKVEATPPGGVNPNVAAKIDSTEKLAADKMAQERRTKAEAAVDALLSKRGPFAAPVSPEERAKMVADRLASLSGDAAPPGGGAGMAAWLASPAGQAAPPEARAAKSLSPEMVGPPIDYDNIDPATDLFAPIPGAEPLPAPGAPAAIPTMGGTVQGAGAAAPAAGAKAPRPIKMSELLQRGLDPKAVPPGYTVIDDTQSLGF